MTTPDPEDVVVLVDDDGVPVGTSPRSEVHTDATPLHLAFSCYLFDEAGRLLMTRRALDKRTWPGVWTNSFCGHPRPGETVEHAVRRYAEHELNAGVDVVTPLLPRFRYRAVDASGLVENEVCPVVTARVTATVRPNPDEVVEHRWVPLGEVRAAVATAPWAFSPWMVAQVGEVEQPGGPGWSTVTGPVSGSAEGAG